MFFPSYGTFSSDSTTFIGPLALPLFLKCPFFITVIYNIYITITFIFLCDLQVLGNKWPTHTQLGDQRTNWILHYGKPLLSFLPADFAYWLKEYSVAKNEKLVDYKKQILKT